MALEQAASRIAKIVCVASFQLQVLEDNHFVMLVQLVRMPTRPVALHHLRRAKSVQPDSSTATQDRAVLQHVKNAQWVSPRCLEPPINLSALYNVPLALGPQLASPHAHRVQREPSTQTRPPLASPSASHALRVIILVPVDKALALLAPLELGAAVLAPRLYLPASHAPPGRTILYQDLQV